MDDLQSEEVSEFAHHNGLLFWDNSDSEGQVDDSCDISVLGDQSQGGEETLVLG